MRLTELKLSLDHTDSELQAAILKRLEIAADELFGNSIFRRSYEARKPAAIAAIKSNKGATIEVIANDGCVWKPLGQKPPS